MAADKIDSVREDTEYAANLLMRHADLVIALAPVRPIRHSSRTAEDHQLASQVEGKGSREQQIRQLAKAAGHSLDAKLRCVTCSLTVPVRRSMAHLEAVLQMRCVGKQALRSSSIKLVPLRSGQDQDQDHSSETKGDDSNSLYLFGKWWCMAVMPWPPIQGLGSIFVPVVERAAPSGVII